MVRRQQETSQDVYVYKQSVGVQLVRRDCLSRSGGFGMPVDHGVSWHGEHCSTPDKANNHEIGDRTGNTLVKPQRTRVPLSLTHGRGSLARMKGK